MDGGRTAGGADGRLHPSFDCFRATHHMAEVEARLRELLVSLGVDVFNYGAGHIRAAEGPCLERIWSSMDPAWIQRYAERQYHRLDRLVRAGFARTCPFTFAEIFATPPESEEQREMETAFPYKNGVVCPIHSPLGRFGLLSAAFETPILSEDTASFELIARIQCVASLAHDRAEQIHAAEARASLGLTRQETACLRWSAGGKTADEIAAILGITERTVRKHLTNVRGKLNVSTRAQAIAKAITLGIASS